VTDYDKKTYKNVVHAGDYYHHLLGPGENDAPLPQWKII
jgi:hypothetical protein